MVLVMCSRLSVFTSLTGGLRNGWDDDCVMVRYGVHTRALCMKHEDVSGTEYIVTCCRSLTLQA